MSKRVFFFIHPKDRCEVTGRLIEYLAARGHPRILTEESVIPGEDPDKWVAKVLARCDSIMILIGNHWLESALAQENDQDTPFVNQLEIALQKGKNVIPVLIEDTKMPSKYELPENLSGITDRKTALLRSGSDFLPDANLLLAALGRRRLKRKVGAVSIVVAAIYGSYLLGLNRNIEPNVSKASGFTYDLLPLETNPTVGRPSDTVETMESLPQTVEAIETSESPDPFGGATTSESPDPFGGDDSSPSGSPDPFGSDTQRAPDPMLANKLVSIKIPSIHFVNTPLNDAIEFLRQKSVELDSSDPDSSDKGVHFFLQETARATPVVNLKLFYVSLEEAAWLTAVSAGYLCKINGDVVEIEPKIGIVKYPDQFGFVGSPDFLQRRQILQEKLSRIVVPEIEFKETPLNLALDLLYEKSIIHDFEQPDFTKKGVNLFLLPEGQAGNEISISSGEESTIPVITLKRSNASLKEILDHIRTLTGYTYEASSQTILIFKRW